MSLCSYRRFWPGNIDAGNHCYDPGNVEARPRQPRPRDPLLMCPALAGVTYDPATVLTSETTTNVMRRDSR